MRKLLRKFKYKGNINERLDEFISNNTTILQVIGVLIISLPFILVLRWGWTWLLSSPAWVFPGMCLIFWTVLEEDE